MQKEYKKLHVFGLENKSRGVCIILNKAHTTIHMWGGQGAKKQTIQYVPKETTNKPIKEQAKKIEETTITKTTEVTDETKDETKQLVLFTGTLETLDLVCFSFLSLFSF